MERVFDTHVHLLQNASMAQSVRSFETYFRLNRVERALFLMIPWEVPDQTENDFTQNAKGLFLKTYFAGRGYAYAGLEHCPGLTVDEQSRRYLAQVREYYAAGFDGIKFLEGKPGMRKRFGFRLSDPVYDRTFSFLEEVGMPVTLHNGDPSAFWDRSKMSEHAIRRGWFVDETNLKLEQMHADILALMKRHPRLRFTQAHCGFTSDRIAEAERFLCGYEFTRFDMTPGGEQELFMSEHREQWLPFFEKTADRWKYGTDTYNFAAPETVAAPPSTDADGRPCYDLAGADSWTRNTLHRPWFLRNWFETDTEHDYGAEHYRGFAMPPALRERIYWSNAVRDLGDPRPVDRAWLLRKLDGLEARYAPVPDLRAYFAERHMEALYPLVTEDIAFMREKL